MRIKRISIRNFRGVLACEVALATTGVTIIEGPNEVGKSSLAEAIDLLLDYPDDSRHKDVKSVKPVHRDVGPEVEVELTTGQYHVVYRKRWFRQAETYLEVISPKPKSLVGRAAHDHMTAILGETLDRTLYRALRFIQGDKIEQAKVRDSTSLTGALDRAATGGAADPKAESTLWQAIKEERERYFTPTGKISQERENLKTRLNKATSEVDEARSALAALEEVGEEHRRIVSQHDRLVRELASAEKELEGERKLSDELKDLALEAERSRLSASQAELDERNAAHALEERREKVESLKNLEDKRARLSTELEEVKLSLEARETERDRAADDLASASEARRQASLALEKAEADSEYRRAKTSLQLLRNRHEQVVESNEQLARARLFIESCKVDKRARGAVDKALRRHVEARAARDAGSPSVLVDALADVSITLDGSSELLHEGEMREITIATDKTIRIDDRVLLHARSGASSTDLQAELESSEQEIRGVADRYGLDPDNLKASAEEALDKLRDAEGELEMAERLKSAALVDLSEQELEAKFQHAKEIVDGYERDRTGLATPDDPDVVSRVREVAMQRCRDAERTELELRERLKVVDKAVNEFQIKARTTGDLLGQAIEEFERAESKLLAARVERSDEELEADRDFATSKLQGAVRERDDAVAKYDSCHPDLARQRLENAEQKIARVREEQGACAKRQSDIEARLDLARDSGLQERIDSIEPQAEQLSREYRDIERRASAANLLYETFSRHRDDARLAYVAPYGEQINRLARLVFGPGTSVEVNPDDFSLKTRSLDHVTVPFESLSTGAREQLGVLERLACAILVNPVNSDDTNEDAGVPVILDDALGYSDHDRLRRLGPAFTEAAKRAQVILMTSTPERYSSIGSATVVQLPAELAQGPLRDAVHNA